MDITEYRQAFHLSASSINEYLDCGFAYRLARIDKRRPEFTPEALIFGTAIHKVLGTFYTEKMVGNKLLLKDLHELFDRHWRELAEGTDNIKYAEGKDFNTLLLEGKELLTVYYEKLPPDNFTVLGVEEPVVLFVEGMGIPLIGYIDLMEEDESGSVIITDWKTSSRSYSFDDINKNLQVTCYLMSLKQNGYADREILIKFDCLIKTKKQKFEQYYTMRTREDERRVTIKINEVWRGIVKGVFIPNDTSWKCNGCLYGSYCKEYMEGTYAETA